MGEYKSCLICFIYKDFYGKWYLSNLEKVGQGKNFMECETLIKDNLFVAGIDSGLLAESKNWSSSSNKKFQL